MTDVAELEVISAQIHDNWFDLDTLYHDTERSELRLPIYGSRWKKRWFGWSDRAPQDPLPAPIATLVIRNVTGVSVKDEADVGRYNISHLAFDAAEGELRIIANIPCEIVARCPSLHVELLRT